MKIESLKKIFAGTAALSVLVFLAALFVDTTWAIRYGMFAVLAGCNWFALSRILIGITTKKFMPAVIGFSLKFVIVVCFLLAGSLVGFEITSFLAALNTFFVALLIFGVFELGAARPAVSAQAELEG